jgi:hypothetical protein
MVDRVSLEVMGFILGGVTAIVIAIGALVVRSHMDGKIAMDQTSSAVMPVALAPRR